jgi:hypothetical protein
MLHHTTIPWLPERMRRLIFSLSCSSGKAANAPKPVSFAIASSQIIGLSRWCRLYAGEREQARILVEVEGRKAGQLACASAHQYELVINLKTAKALGLTISREVQLTADEVIE